MWIESIQNKTLDPSYAAWYWMNPHTNNLNQNPKNIK